MAVTTLDISFHQSHKHFESTTRLVGFLYVLIFLRLFPLTIVQSAFEVELERTKYTESERKQLRDNANAVNTIFDEIVMTKLTPLLGIDPLLAEKVSRLNRDKRHAYEELLQRMVDDWPDGFPARFQLEWPGSMDILGRA
ncbi:hypothetical protein BDZ88DRAFT_447871 [Geranomyces variabilis]|nr:hypothetical protein BDZ88DRAFT_447871 [Geranomyces variabilis]KAJ3143046.1 hypothetical protein HDU90_002920 [Geranomyces variabilis]